MSVASAYRERHKSAHVNRVSLKRKRKRARKRDRERRKVFYDAPFRSRDSSRLSARTAHLSQFISDRWRTRRHSLRYRSKDDFADGPQRQNVKGICRSREPGTSFHSEPSFPVSLLRKAAAIRCEFMRY